GTRHLDFRRARIFRRPQFRSGERLLRLVLPRLPQQRSGAASVGEAGMKPEADQVLNMSAMQLLTQILPQLPAGYAQGTASLIAVLSMMAAQEYERGADIRAAENNDVRTLFRDFAWLVADIELRSQLLKAAEGRDPSL